MSSPETERPRPTISIYQNPDHVAGILQQIHSQPLVLSESRESGVDASTSISTDRGGDAGIRAGASVPGVGDASLHVGGKGGRTTDTGEIASTRSVLNFEFSQAYYLYEVRNALRSHGDLKCIVGASDASGLQSGDFVEFQATFRPNEINALLDILSPDLVAAIAEAQVRHEGVQGFDAFVDDYEGLKVFTQKIAAKAEMRADIARAVARAVRVDFRSEKTREFYGSIGSGEDAVTAITICDNPHFTVDDEDRILDGEFTVLGKVTSPSKAEVPIFERNKVLDRLKPEGVDTLFAELRNSVAGQTDRLQTTAGPDLSVADDIFDVAFASRVIGPSFKVIPIAIYV